MQKAESAELCANELSKISCLKYFTVSFDFVSENCVRTVDKVRGTPSIPKNVILKLQNAKISSVLVQQ